MTQKTKCQVLMSSTCQHRGCNCAFFYDCALIGVLFTALFRPCTLLMHGSFFLVLFVRALLSVLGHGLGSVASFVVLFGIFRS
jgi:hypothetical protein